MMRIHRNVCSDECKAGGSKLLEVSRSAGNHGTPFQRNQGTVFSMCHFYVPLARVRYQTPGQSKAESFLALVVYIQTSFDLLFVRPFGWTSATQYVTEVACNNWRDLGIFLHHIAGCIGHCLSSMFGYCRYQLFSFGKYPKNAYYSGESNIGTSVKWQRA